MHKNNSRNYKAFKTKHSAMKKIKALYDDFIKIPFPNDLKGIEIDGIDLIILDSDTAGLIDKFINHDYQLKNSDRKKLLQNLSEIEKIKGELNENERIYFSLLIDIIKLINEHMTV